MAKTLRSQCRGPELELRSLVRERDPTCYNQGFSCHNQDPVQPNKYMLKKKKKMKKKNEPEKEGLERWDIPTSTNVQSAPTTLTACSLHVGELGHTSARRKVSLYGSFPFILPMHIITL